MEGDRWIIYVGIALACVVFAWLRSRSFHQGRLEGIRKAVLDLSRTCSFHYETKDQPLPEKVDKALDYMANAMKRGEGTKGKIFLYLTGAAMLGDAMGEVAWQKGFDAGRLWTEPSEGEKRLDLTLARSGILPTSRISDSSASSMGSRMMGSKAPPMPNMRRKPFDAWRASSPRSSRTTRMPSLSTGRP